MKKMIKNALGLLALAFLTSPMQAQDKLFTLEDLNFGGTNYRNMQPKNMFLTWWGDQLIQTDVEECYTIDAKTGKKTLLFTLDDINKWDCKLFVPEGALATYQAADQWKDFFFAEATVLPQAVRFVTATYQSQVEEEEIAGQAGNDGNGQAGNDGDGADRHARPDRASEHDEDYMPK